MKLIELEEVDSTNDYLKREYQNLPMQTCVTAKYQTKGRVEMVMFGKVMQMRI